MSRTFTDQTKWMQSDEIFKKICDIWGTPYRSCCEQIES